MLRSWLPFLFACCLLVNGCNVQQSVSPEELQQVDEPAAVDSLTNSQKAILPTIEWKDAPHHIGEKVFLVGQVVNVGKSNAGHRFLNFGRRRSDVTGFIDRHLVDQFSEPPEILFQGKAVRVQGELYRYRGNPNIRILGPEDVEVLPEDVVPSRLATAGEPVVRKVAGTMTIATFNILNLFDSMDDPYHQDERANAKLWEDMERLAGHIHQIDADILVLEEVENRGYLDQFNRALLADLGYRHVVLIEGNDKRGIDVAVLSRIPVGPVTSYRHLRFPDENGREMYFRRDLLQVRIEPDKGRPFDVLAVHLKSQYGGERSDVIRLGEARMLRRVVDGLLAEDSGARLIVCGDFNDEIGSPTLQTILGEGENKLASFFDDHPLAERITYNQEPYRSMVDFILASPAMAKSYEQGSYRIFPGSPAKTGSDHNAVVARFRIDEGR